MAKLKGLGRGLDALLGPEAPPADGERLTELEVRALQPGKYQPRTRMDETSLQELAASIGRQGIMQPILVRPTAAGHEIIAGERRWRAAQIAGLTRVPVIVRAIADEHALAMSLIENIQREELSPLEEAQGILRLVEEFQLTHQQAAEAVGRSRSAVSNLLRLLGLPQGVRQLLQEHALEMGHARALLGLPPERQEQAAAQVVAGGLSVRQTEELVHQLTAADPAPTSAPKAAAVARVEKDLTQLLGMRVSVKPLAGGRGKLIIDFGTDEDLQKVLQKLRSSL